MTDVRSKALGLAWLMAAVGLAAAVALGLSPFIRRIPWSWEQAISHVVGSAPSNDACSNPRAEEAFTQLVARLYPIDPEDDRYSIHVHIAPDPAVNAFAELGGNITLNAGLLEQADSAEEVAGVLAHEIEHVRRRHILEGFVTHLMTTEGIRIVFSGGSVSNTRWTNYFLHMGFSRAQEAEADEGALRRLQKARIDNQGFKQFFERMKERASVPSILSDHPSNHTRSEMTEKFENTDTTPVMTDQDWKTFKEYCQGN